MFKPIDFNNLKKGLLIGFAFLLVVILFQELPKLPDNQLHLVFCSVGQGDAIYIKTPQGQDILIDGGPSDAVLNCLSQNLPFWDKKIEMVFLTHPQADHLNGLISVFENYQVERFFIEPVGNKSAGFQKLVELAQAKGIDLYNPYSGQTIKTKDNVVLKIVWPDKNWLIQNSTPADLAMRPARQWASEVGGPPSSARIRRPAETTSDRGKPLTRPSANNPVLGAYTANLDLNSTSIVLLLSFGGFDAYLGGDADIQIEDEIINTKLLSDVEVFKVPHHGAKTGFSDKLLQTLKPELAIISVGKNSYGHPAGQILQTLKNAGLKTYRTDQEGNLEIITNGQKFWLKTL